MAALGSGRKSALAILLVCEVAAMSCWFATSASIASIRAHEAMSPFYEALLTSSVQAGFVVGAFFSALFALPDRIDLRRLFRASALVAALCTGALVLLPPVSPVAPVLRFFTGVSLAGVYPVGMALAATWAMGDLGLLIGLLVGALETSRLRLAASRRRPGRARLAPARSFRQRWRFGRRRPGGADRHWPQQALGAEIRMVERVARLALAPAAPRQFRLFRPHVGALRHVVLDRRLRRREFQGALWRRAAAASGARDLLHRRFWGARRAARRIFRRPPRPHTGHQRRHGRQRSLRPADRPDLWWIGDGCAGRGRGVGRQHHRRFGAVFSPRWWN